MSQNMSNRITTAERQSAKPIPFNTEMVRANLPEWCGEEITTMAQFEKAVAV